MKCPYNMCNGTGFIYTKICPQCNERTPIALESSDISCKKCGKILASSLEIVASSCQCRLEREEKIKHTRKLESAHIPKEYWDRTIDGYYLLDIPLARIEKNKSKLDLLQEFITNPELFLNKYRILWIWGQDRNAGHTSLAVAVAKKLLDITKKVRFIDMQDLINMFTNFEQKDEFFADLNSNNVFVLDNAFDTQKCYISKDYIQIQLYNWLNTCLHENKYFICTSNISIYNINEKYSQCKDILVRPNTFISLNITGSVPLPKIIEEI